MKTFVFPSITKEMRSFVDYVSKKKNPIDFDHTVSENKVIANIKRLEFEHFMIFRLYT